MQVVLGKTGYVMVTGKIRSDIEIIQCKNGSPRAKASLVIDVQRDAQGHPINDDQGRPRGVWANLTAWGDYAKILGSGQRGDGVLAIGKITEWEHEGKVYRTLSINNDGYLALSYPTQPAGNPEGQNPCEYQPGAMTEITDDDDGDLPF